MFKPKAFQDYFPKMSCFGCGPNNRHGLRIKSFWAEDDLNTICRWQPKPIYSSGMPNVLQGGIIATLIDCHSVWTAIANDYKDENRPFGAEPMPGYVTGILGQIKLIHPTPMDVPVLLVAHVITKVGRKTTVACDLLARDEICATGQTVAVKLPKSLYIR